MKRFLLILITLPMLLLGCAKDGAENGGKEVTGGIVFSPGTYADNITEYEWADGEQVHMFMVPAGKNINDTGAEAAIYKFVYGAGVVDDKLVGLGATNIMKFPEGKSVKFISYKPYTTANNIVGNGYKFTVDTHNQTKYKDIDLLSANDGVVYSKLMGTTSVALSYRHMMSKVVLRLKSTDATKLASVGAVSMAGMPTHVEYNFITEQYGNISQDDRVTGSEKVTTDAVNTKVFEAIVVPQTNGWSNSQREFTFNFNAMAHSFLIKKSDIYLPGMMSVYEIDLDTEISGEIIVKDPMVVDWGDGGNVEHDNIIDGLFTDDVFREYISRTYSKGGPIFLKDVKNVTELWFSKTDLIAPQTITSLAGIEAFKSLTYLTVSGLGITNIDVSNNKALTSLQCDDNQLTSLDVSTNTALTTLYCHSNRLTSLDVSNNTALTSLQCDGNQLTSLDVSTNTALTSLYCSSNRLTSLDVSRNLALTTLYCSSNPLTSLDVSRNLVLTRLYCNSNQLTSLDLSKNTALTRLYCNSNQLTSLDLSKNTALTSLECNSNQLTSLDLSTHLNLGKFIWVRFYNNPGTGDGGSTTPVNFEVKLPTGTAPGSLPSAFPQSGYEFTWEYQFKNAAGAVIGFKFPVTTLYTNL